MLYGVAKGGYTGGYNVIFIKINQTIRVELSRPDLWMGRLDACSLEGAEVRCR